MLKAVSVLARPNVRRKTGSFSVSSPQAVTAAHFKTENAVKGELCMRKTLQKDLNFSCLLVCGHVGVG